MKIIESEPNKWIYTILKTESKQVIIIKVKAIKDDLIFFEDWQTKGNTSIMAVATFASIDWKYLPVDETETQIIAK